MGCLLKIYLSRVKTKESNNLVRRVVMPTQRSPLKRVYTINGSPLSSIQQEPILADRAPTVADDAELGTLWVYEAAETFYVLTARAPLDNTWVLPQNGGTAATFSSLTVTPGPTSLTGAFTTIAAGNATQIANDASVNAVTIGSITGASSTFIQGGTGDINIATSAAGRIFVGSVAMTANLQVGSSTVGQNIFVAGAITTGAETTNINTGNKGASSTVNVLTGNATAGIQTFNVLTGTRAGAVNIGTGNAAHQVIIGTTTGTALTSILAGTSGIFLNAPFVLLPNNVHIYTGSGAPIIASTNVGDLYINYNAADLTDRLFIATDAGGSWTNIVCAA